MLQNEPTEIIIIKNAKFTKITKKFTKTFLFFLRDAIKFMNKSQIPVYNDITRLQLDVIKRQNTIFEKQLNGYELELAKVIQISEEKQSEIDRLKKEAVEKSEKLENSRLRLEHKISLLNDEIG